MSFALTLSALTKNERMDILKKFTAKSQPTLYNSNPIIYQCFLANKKSDTLFLPLAHYQKFVGKNDPFPNGEAEEFSRMKKLTKFTSILLTEDTDPSGRKRDQQSVVIEAVQKLKKTGVVFLACYTGMGKTAMTIYTTIKLGLKTVVITYLDEVKKQWVKAFNRHSSGVKVQIVEGDDKLDNSADVYIIGVIKVSKMSRNLFLNIGTVVIDEAQMGTEMLLTNILFKFSPRYFIGLSATPDRKDKGLDKLFELCFGPRKNFVIRREVKNFSVYKVQTNFKPEVEYIIRFGKLVPNWTKLVKSVESNPEKHQLIADLCLDNPDHTILVLCMYNVLAKGIHTILQEAGEDVELVIGNKKSGKWNQNARVIIMGMKKGGVGLDIEGLTMSIIASDTQDVRQYEGRVREKDNIIYHLVDYYHSFEDHWKPCENWYEERGATISTIGVEHIFENRRGMSTRTVVPNKRMLPRRDE
jgi:superfamily II DNA or RNA helicase